MGIARMTSPTTTIAEPRRRIDAAGPEIDPDPWAGGLKRIARTPPAVGGRMTAVRVAGLSMSGVAGRVFGGDIVAALHGERNRSRSVRPRAEGTIVAPMGSATRSFPAEDPDRIGRRRPDSIDAHRRIDHAVADKPKGAMRPATKFHEFDDTMLDGVRPDTEHPPAANRGTECRVHVCFVHKCDESIPEMPEGRNFTVPSRSRVLVMGDRLPMVVRTAPPRRCV